ncbi:MAG: SEC-C metal-binding domain-containing protein [Desulfobulbaceae bacterium]|nr:SEC-C metal-binding domain-containing protein [Desulfobulbaceae bacterium]
MDIRTGEVMPYAEMLFRMAGKPEDEEFFKPVPPQKITAKTGRNSMCPCGSGIKFKKCCLHGAARKPVLSERKNKGASDGN